LSEVLIAMYRKLLSGYMATGRDITTTVEVGNIIYVLDAAEQVGFTGRLRFSLGWGERAYMVVDKLCSEPHSYSKEPGQTEK
jgi:hypothetical protein